MRTHPSLSALLAGEKCAGRVLYRNGGSRDLACCDVSQFRTELPSLSLRRFMALDLTNRQPCRASYGLWVQRGVPPKLLFPGTFWFAPVARSHAQFSYYFGPRSCSPPSQHLSSDDDCNKNCNSRPDVAFVRLKMWKLGTCGN